MTTATVESVASFLPERSVRIEELGEHLGLRRAELERWRRENPRAVGDSHEFQATILPRLASVPLNEIMAAWGIAKSKHQ